jgi:hypothetical protein
MAYLLSGEIPLETSRFHGVDLFEDRLAEARNRTYYQGRAFHLDSILSDPMYR